MPKRDHAAATTKNGEENDYERQRAKRIEENRARMAALGLPNMATSSSLMSSSRRGKERSEKKNKYRNDDDDDDEYMPVVEESEVSSSSEEDDKEWSASRTAKGKKKSSTPKKKIQVQKLRSNSDFVDEDEAFMQALALSIGSKMVNVNEGCSGLPENSYLQPTSAKSSERKGIARSKKESGIGKQKKQLSSRVQMTEDELIVHFFQFDEAGKGAISVKDLQLMAATHDFTWTDKELSDMIYCFDTDGDGKLSLDDFRKIVGRCKMIQNS